MILSGIVPYSGATFWAVFIMLVITSRITAYVKFKQVAVKNLLLISISLLVISSVMQSTALPTALVLASVLVYVVGKQLALEDATHRRKALVIPSIVVIVLGLSYFKYSWFQQSANALWHQLVIGSTSVPSEARHFFLIGVSYFTFKFIHFLVEAYKKKITVADPLTFVNYIVFFPNFFSGPINRYGQFAEDMQKPQSISPFSQDAIVPIRRLVTGLFKKVVLANNLLPYAIVSMNYQDPEFDTAKAVIGIYAYMLYIYFDFSGYTDMAIACSHIIGIRMPENFNAPFLKRNLQQFWANWHMSLTSWLTDYIYWPLARKLRHFESLKKHPIIISNIAIVTTFIVCGLWHGDGLNFFIWGLYHGFGLAILNVYTFIEKKYVSMKWKKRINKTKGGYAISTFITFQFVAFGFLIFGCSMEDLKHLFTVLVG